MSEVLRVLNWGANIGPQTVANFEIETGSKVDYETYGSIEELEGRVFSARADCDIVFAASTTSNRMIAANLLQPLDKTALSNIDNLSAPILEKLRRFDPDGSYLVPYLWGSIGLIYNPAIVDEVVPGADMSDLATLFNPVSMEKLAPRGVALFDSPNEAIALALNYLGRDPYSDHAGHMAEAQALFAAIRPHIRYFDTLKLIAGLASGDIGVALSYSGVAGIAKHAAQDAGPRNAGKTNAFRYAIPKQGTLVWIDNMSIPAKSKNPSGAHRFIDYMLRPDVIADVTNAVFYANANAAASPYVNPDILNDPNFYPPPELVARLYSEKTLDEGLKRQRSELWEAMKSGG